MAGMRRRVVSTAVGSLIAAAVGCYIGWHGSTVEPKRPTAVCPVVRPELLDRLVPNHTQYDEPFGGEGYAGMACVVKGSNASADLAMMRFGRRRGEGPIASAQGGMAYFLSSRRWSIQLGDEAWYFFDGAQKIHVVVRIGVTVIQVIYRAELGEETMITSGRTLAEEVLASL